LQTSDFQLTNYQFTVANTEDWTFYFLLRFYQYWDFLKYWQCKKAKTLFFIRLKTHNIFAVFFSRQPKHSKTDKKDPEADPHTDIAPVADISTSTADAMPPLFDEQMQFLYLQGVRCSVPFTCLPHPYSSSLAPLRVAHSQPRS